MLDQDLLDKLQKIERLYAGATTQGEKAAAADAIARITKRLNLKTGMEKRLEIEGSR